ncbi:diaminopimelate epimerase [Dermacoccus nishinomiyaensis]|uniref:diaminopimelate epimerase n=1 Tax=Dermacoccus nishinomiyaensis TaxID=1274 RepID=UPI0028A1DA86|nr:diaminopimelate epimerase [Dermacoccus nishinomiyaensis]
MTRIHFTKGHGTQNDFVLVPDESGELDLTPEQVAYLCHRHAGIGADGVIRVVRTANVPEVAHLAPQARWFMDYRNADGSLAEMCGNGTRVFAEYLRSRGLVSGDEGAPFVIATRAGLKEMVAVPHGWAVDLGQWRLARAEEAERRGMDSVVQVHGSPDPLPALSLDLGNPHTVVALPPSVHLSALDLSDAPHIDPHPEQGSNVEFVHAIEHAHIGMRVHERGSGETRSCGTGAAAAALATWWWGGQPADQVDWRVDVLGGTLGVHIKGTEVALSGPAVLVADGEIDLSQL